MANSSRPFMNYSAAQIKEAIEKSPLLLDFIPNSTVLTREFQEFTANMEIFWAFKHGTQKDLWISKGILPRFIRQPLLQGNECHQTFVTREAQQWGVISKKKRFQETSDNNVDELEALKKEAKEKLVGARKNRKKFTSDMNRAIDKAINLLKKEE